MSISFLRGHSSAHDRWSGVRVHALPPLTSRRIFRNFGGGLNYWKTYQEPVGWKFGYFIRTLRDKVTPDELGPTLVTHVS